jgi:hypothetical protein
MAESDFFDFREYYQPDITIGLPEGNFVISGDISVDEMGLFSFADRALNQMMFAALSEGTDDEEKLAVDAANRGHDLLIAKIKKRNENVPDDLKLLPAVVLALIAKLSQNVSATYEIISTLTLGSAAARANAAEDTPLEQLDELDAALESGAPLAPPEPSPQSSTPSSEAAASEEAAGTGTGGETSPGGSSRATSEPQPTTT